MNKYPNEQVKCAAQANLSHRMEGSLACFKIPIASFQPTSIPSGLGLLAWTQGPLVSLHCPFQPFLRGHLQSSVTLADPQSCSVLGPTAATLG